MILMQKTAGLAAILSALIYTLAFVYFGAFWSYPTDAEPSIQMSYLRQHQSTISFIMFFMYVVFGCLLTVLVVGLHKRLDSVENACLQIGTLFGAIWIGLLMISGMLSNIGLAHVVELANSNPQKALDTWIIFAVIIDSIGGGNELLGGLWVLMISIVALKKSAFSTFFNYWGMLVGIAGLVTIYPHDIFTEIFGVTQIVWFIWLGINMLK